MTVVVARLIWIAVLLVGACGSQPGSDVNVSDNPIIPAEDCVEFDLLKAVAEAPNQVYLYFGLQTCEGEPLGGLNDTDFVVFENQEPVSVFESELTMVPTPVGFALYTILLLDMSGSILHSGELPALQEAVKGFIDAIADNQAISIGIFDGRPNPDIVMLYSQDKTALKKKIDGLSDFEQVDNSTNLNGAILYGLDQSGIVSNLFLEPGLVVGNLVVFTDGKDQACGNSPTSCGEGYANNVSTVAAVQQSTMWVFSIGLGEETDPDYLASIGKDGHIQVGSGGDIAAAFVEAAGWVEKTSEHLYVLGYCTPKRGGEHHLSVQVRKDDCTDGADPCLETGELGFSFTADGFYDECDEELLTQKADLFLEKNCHELCAIMNATDLVNVPALAACLLGQTGYDETDLLAACDVTEWGSNCDGCIVKLNGTEFQCGIVRDECL